MIRGETGSRGARKKDAQQRVYAMGDRRRHCEVTAPGLLLGKLGQLLAAKLTPSPRLIWTSRFL